MSPKTPSPPKVRIAIIGGGIAGLCIAAFLRNHPQYSITVFERRSPDLPELSGTAFGMRTNGISIAKQLGITREEIDGVVGAGFRTYDIREKRMSMRVLGDGLNGEDALWFVFRQDFKTALLRRVVSGEGGGEPVEVVYDSCIVGVDPELGIINFANGTSTEADLIIGADGIHSKVRAAVIPLSHPAPTPAGLSIYRFILPMNIVKEAIKPNPLPAMINYDKGAYISIIAAGDKGNRNVVMYPCRGFEYMNFAFAVPDSDLGQQKRYSWNAKGNKEEMMEKLQGFPEWLVRIFSRNPPQVQLFQVRDQDPLPTYVKGRTVLIGDAAHPMVPYQSQGANQSLEDVEGLNTLLADVSDRNSIPELLRVWDSIRRPRASEVQRRSRASQAKISTKDASDAFVDVKPYVRMRDAIAQLQREAGVDLRGVVAV